MNDAIARVCIARLDLPTFAPLDELGLVVTGQYLRPNRAVLAGRILEAGGDERRAR